MMLSTRWYTSVAFFTCAILWESNGFAPTRGPFVTRPSTTPEETKSFNERTSTSLNGMIDPLPFLGQNTEVLAYTDDPLGDLISGANGVIIGGILATVGAVGVGFATLLPSVGAAKFILTEEEEKAVSRVLLAYDSKEWEKEVTEEGTRGYVNRRRQAVEAKNAYQAGKLARDVKDKSLRYSEADLGFIASLIHAAQPNIGDVLVDLGSGMGRSTLGCAAIFPGFKKCIGIEFLQPLVKLSNSYKGKVKGKKAPVEFKCADFATEDLSDADIVFAAATYFNDADLKQALSTLKPGAKVMTIDKRLGSGFRLISTVDDPSGDLVLNTGYVYEKL